MFLAYLDEVGESGAFISKDHPNYNTSAGFGYAGFIIPEFAVRKFGATFQQQKRTLFAKEFAAAKNPGQWEVKGSSVFRSKTPVYSPQNIRVFMDLCRELLESGGQLFYYVDEKPKGTPKQVSLDSERVERLAMAETVNRLSRAADKRNGNILFMIDAINEDRRSKRLPNMWGHILGGSAERPEMRRAIEPPMHVDSVLSACIQFADWVAAIINRAVEYQLRVDDDCRWVGKAIWPIRHNLFTLESKLHFLPDRSVADINNRHLLSTTGPLIRSDSLGLSSETVKKMEQLFHKSVSRSKTEKRRQRSREAPPASPGDIS
jgi:hypothetical protein